VISKYLSFYIIYNSREGENIIINCNSNDYLTTVLNEI